MSDFLLKQIERKEKRKTRWGCFFSCLFLLSFWSLIIYVGVCIFFKQPLF